MQKIFQVDAFTRRIFSGNPAAVVPLEHWLDDAVLQSIAAENNLAETAFFVATADAWEIRWFTPTAEVALCGHATLASAHVLVKHLGCTEPVIRFETRDAGPLLVERRPDQSLAMSFPAISLHNAAGVADLIADALGAMPEAIYIGHYSADQFDYLAVFSSQAQVAGLKPDTAKFSALESRGVITSAMGDACDFVSRYFAPNVGINEDPVTGSAHCLLTPYWADKLKKTDLAARQISTRGGELNCCLQGDRVILIGQAVDYLVGEIHI